MLKLGVGAPEGQVTQALFQPDPESNQTQPTLTKLNNLTRPNRFRAKYEKC